ncbi:MAG: hypothetical protein AABX49_00755 [Nanoarchaeota archaeon]
MSIQFISPNPEQKEALDELEKLINVLEIRPNKKLKRNVRFVKGFTKALLIAGKNHSKLRLKTVQKTEVKEIEPIKEYEEQKIQVSKPPSLINTAPLPPPPPSPTSMKSTTQAINIKGGGKSFEDFVQKISKEDGMLRFNIIEPEMESIDWKILNYVKSNLKQQIIKDPTVLDRDDFLINQIKNTCQVLKIKYSDSYLKKIKYYLIKYIKGFGKIEPLLKDQDISEIICDSYNDIKVKYKNELISTNIQFDTNEELDNFILNLAEKSNKVLSETNPELKTVFQNLRISAFYNPIMGSRFTIAKQ